MNQLDHLFVILRSLSRNNQICLAYSGGLDSRFLAHAISLSGCNPLLFHIIGPHVPERESALAQSRAKSAGWALNILKVNPLDLQEVRANGKDRCYFCKHFLFSQLLEKIRKDFGQAILCDGSNLSDQKGYRPGLRALAELDIQSPLALAGFDKAMIRTFAAKTGLEEPNQPSRPCLLTRFPYEMEPTHYLLHKVDAIEEIVESVCNAIKAAPDFRIRVDGSRFLLQISLDDTSLFMPTLIARLQSANLPIPNLLQTKTITGYFDAKD